MPRADELQHDDRFRLPDWVGEGIATVDHVAVFVNKARIHWKRYGQRGVFECSPQYEIGDG